MASTRSTRSASRTLAKVASHSPPPALNVGGTAGSKRKKAKKDTSDTAPRAAKRQNVGENSAENEVAGAPVPTNDVLPAPVVDAFTPGPDDLIPSVLTFSIEDAKTHLTGQDPRFKKLFNKIPCKPFEHVGAVEPFRTLATSILGQQISWKAARSIKHKFIRLFDPSIPEELPAAHEKDVEFFPTAGAVAGSNITTLRTAGLSARKAEYILDLASRFADGRLSAKILREATDQEVFDLLIQVKGIGPWTIEMFSIFDLRRPNILPCGDLGVQRGLLRWILATHSPEDARKTRIAPHRLPGASEEEAAADPSTEETQLTVATDQGPGSSVLPAPTALPEPLATPVKKKGKGKGTPTLPPPTPFSSSVFTGTIESPIEPLPLPDGLSVSTMKSRLGGKKTKKGLYLTPEEMQALTEPWAPYRSIGVWYMWSIVDEDTR